MSQEIANNCGYSKPIHCEIYKAKEKCAKQKQKKSRV